MKKFLCAVLAATIFFPPIAARAADDQSPAPAEDVRPRRPGLIAPAEQGKAEHLKELIKILESISDDDYDDALTQAPKQDGAPQTASRSDALQSAYSTLASLEYSQAQQGASADDAQKIADAQKRIAAPQETGWAVDLLKWVGNAAINYALNGGETYVGRSIDNSKTGQLNRKVNKLSQDLSATDDAQRRSDDHYQIGQVYEELAASAAVKPSEEALRTRKEARLKRLIALLKAMSDGDYKDALAHLPPDSAGTKLAARADALKAAYLTMAAVEYQAAGERSSKELERVKAQDAAAVGVDPGTLKETGWGVDLLKWLGNAAINYALNGGETYVGRSLGDSPAAKLEKDIAALEIELAKADEGKKAKLHSKLGADYEALAALPPDAESDAARAERKKERLSQLADLLQAVSDDDYKEALKHVHNQAAQRPELRSRKAVLKTTYTTLAALEYRSAGDKGAGDLKRVAESDAKDVAVDPETLQETGWFSDMLDVATLGGVGYLIYENQRKHGHHGAPQFVPPPLPQPQNTPGPNPSPNPHPGPCPNPLDTQGPDGQCQPYQKIQGGPNPASFDGRWLMKWAVSRADAPVPCTGTDEVAVSGGRFSYSGSVYCPCYMPPPPPGFVKDPREISFGCQGYTQSFGCTGSIDASGRAAGVMRITGAPWSFSGSCVSAGGCSGSGNADGQPATWSGFNVATCPNSDCIAVPGLPVVQLPTQCPAGSTFVNGVCRRPVDPFPRPPVRVHCMAYSWSCGYRPPRLTTVSAKVDGLYASLDGMQSELAGLELDSPQAADLHQKLGTVYEQLAESLEEKPAAKPAPKPKPVEKPVQKPVVEAPAPAPQVETRKPAEKDSVHKAMQEMEDLEKEMKRKIRPEPLPEQQDESQ